MRLKAQAAPFRPVYHLGEQVQGLETLSGGFWKVTTSKGTVVQARAVIIAAGVGAFGPNRPPLPGIEAYEGKSVFYYVTHREAFRGKRVVIAGGGDTAVDWALSLAEIADRVSVIHRRDKFRAAPESEARLKALAKSGKLDLVVPYQLHGAGRRRRPAHGRDRRPRSTARPSGSRPTRCCRSSACRCRWGRSPTGSSRWSTIRSPSTPSTTATSKPGIFAIGDVVTYPGKLKLILTGFAEAAIAARSAYALVHPETPLHFEYSTTSGLPTA